MNTSPNPETTPIARMIEHYLPGAMARYDMAAVISMNTIAQNLARLEITYEGPSAPPAAF